MHDKLSIIDLMSFQDYNLWHHVVCIHRYWPLNLLLINALSLSKRKKSRWHLLYPGSLNIHQALERCWTIQSHPDEGKPSASDCLNALRLNRSWQVNQCRWSIRYVQIVLFQWKMQTVVSQVLINCIVHDPHIECCLGKPKALSRPYWYKLYNRVMLYCKLTKT